MVRLTGPAPALFALVALGTATGCGSRLQVAEVEGVVRLGGKPLPQVRIQFMPDPEKKTVGPISSGTTDEQGHFKLVCADQRLGAVVGWHRVVITDMKVNLFKTPRQGRRDDDDTKGIQKQKPQPPRVPDKYTMSGQTPLIIEVKPEKQEMAFDLTR